MKNKIFVITTFHNIRDYIMPCIQSLLMQRYDNWHCILVDNCSDDGTDKLLPYDDSRFTIIRNEERNIPLMDDHQALMKANAGDNDIMVFLCGDDLLLGEYALTTINNIYNDNTNILLTHGQYVTSLGEYGHQIPYNEVSFRGIRNLGHGGWNYNCSHLKSFRFKLYKELMRQDPDLNCYRYNDEIIDNTADVYMFTPLMEIAGLKRIYFCPTPLYIWRVHNDNECFIKPSPKLYISELPKFQQLN